MEQSLQNIRIQKWVLAVSVVLLGGKVVAYYLTNSVAILTDALEAIVNVVAGVLGLYSLYLAAKPRDSDHPYGHGKVEFLSAAAEGLMILVAGVLIIVEAIRQIMNPLPLHELDTGMIIISGTALVNFIMGSVSVRIGVKNNSLALVASGKHLQTDCYSTVGILVGLLILYFTDIAWIDSVVAILFAVIILITGFKIVRSSVAGIMDERDNVLLEQLAGVLNKERSRNWVDLHNVRIIKYGSTLHLDCHLTVPWYLNVHEAHDEIDKVGKIAREEFSRTLELFIHADGCLPTSCPICIKDDCPVRQHAFQKKVEWDIHNIQQDRKHTIET